ncbi:hypothetical protein GCM10010460_19110 [Microbacterium terrae]|nr:hypothetical protein GCM10017594_07480 [Microbacterium terrae]
MRCDRVCFLKRAGLDPRRVGRPEAAPEPDFAEAVHLLLGVVHEVEHEQKPWCASFKTS